MLFSQVELSEAPAERIPVFRFVLIWFCFFIQEARILVGKAFQKTDEILEEHLDKLKAVSLSVYFSVNIL